MIVLQCKRSIVAPAKMVGMFAAQSIEEPTTQLLLKTFRNAGIASKANVTRCVPRIKEIMSQFKSKLCGFTLGLRVRSKTLNASRAARCIRLSRDGFRVAQVSAHVFLEVLVKNVVNTDANRPADMSPRCATRRQPTRDADEWWCDDGTRYLRIMSSQSAARRDLLAPLCLGQAFRISASSLQHFLHLSPIPR